MKKYLIIKFVARKSGFLDWLFLRETECKIQILKGEIY